MNDTPVMRILVKHWATLLCFEPHEKSNPKNSEDAIPHDDILGFLPGTRLNERQCHTAFAHLREQGEWFRPEADLLAFIADLNLAVA